MEEPPEQEESVKLREVAEKSEEVLAQFKTVFPFDFFQDTIYLYRKSLFVEKKIFFGVHKDISIHYSDLLDSHLNTGIMFGSVDVKSKFITDQHYEINWLRVGDARRIHSILHGLIIAQKEEINLDKIPIGDLVRLLERIGSKSNGKRT